MDASTLYSKLGSPLLFFTYIDCQYHFSDIKPNTSWSIFLSSSPCVNPSPSILQGIVSKCLSISLYFLQRLISGGFLLCLYTFLFFFFYPCLFDSSRFVYSQAFVMFLFSKQSDSFTSCQFYSFRYLSFSIFDYEHSTFLSQIPFIYPGCIFLLFVSKFPIILHFL